MISTISICITVHYCNFAEWQAVKRLVWWVCVCV